MDEEMDALDSQGAWDLVSTPTNAVVMGYCWVYTLKYNPKDWLIDIRLDSRLKVTVRPMTSIILRHSR